MNDYLYDNLENILEKFSIDYVKHNNRITFPCPIHNSDNEDSLSILLEGANVNGLWTCWSNHCEKEYGKTIFGLIKGILSQEHEASNKEVFSWIKKNVGVVPTEDISLKTYLKLVTPKEIKEEGKIDRSYIRKSLSRPVSFFIDRGYSEEILDKYDIGICYQKRDMFMRAVIPVYNENHEYMVGCLGRSLNQKCDKCGYYHYKKCPENNLEKKWSEKWINSDFYSGNYLFNFWFAKKHIYNTGSIILVEGPLDVLRLEEAGIHNSVALFGTSLSGGQHEILNRLPIHSLIISTDNDDSGREAAKKIEEQTNRYFNIKVIQPIKKDWGEHSVEEVKEIWKNKK